MLGKVKYAKTQKVHTVSSPVVYFWQWRVWHPEKKKRTEEVETSEDCLR